MTSRPLELALEASFDQLSATVPAHVGIAIARPDRTYSLGRWWSGVAWSTIKVPLAIAALRGDWLRAKDLAVQAITESDNHAAEQLWAGLGDPVDAARRVQKVIAEGGDTATTVESRRLRRGYTAFGQTQWTLQRQARFAAELPSIPESADVIDLMQRITAGQRWGLAAKGFAARRLGPGNPWGIPGPAVRYRADTVGTMGCGAGRRGSRRRVRDGRRRPQHAVGVADQPASRASALLRGRPRR